MTVEQSDRDHVTCEAGNIYCLALDGIILLLREECYLMLPSHTVSGPGSELQTEVLTLLQGLSRATKAPRTGKPPTSHTPVIQLTLYPCSLSSSFSAGEVSSF